MIVWNRGGYARPAQYTGRGLEGNQWIIVAPSAITTVGAVCITIGTGIQAGISFGTPLQAGITFGDGQQATISIGEGSCQ